jgi:hypothetical protein
LVWLVEFWYIPIPLFLLHLVRFGLLWLSCDVISAVFPLLRLHLRLRFLAWR